MEVLKHRLLFTQIFTNDCSKNSEKYKSEKSTNKIVI
jgi:hypothetical protein